MSQQTSAVEQLGLRTAPFDSRFPNQNQTKNCWQNFMDYQRCIKNKGEEYQPCTFFKKNFKSLCPVAWVSHRKLDLMNVCAWACAQKQKSRNHFLLSHM